MASLYPVFEAPAMMEKKTTMAVVYGKSVRFNFSTFDFEMDGGHHMIETNGQDTWIQWCLKALITKRRVYAVYSNNYGSEADDSLKLPTRAAVESEVRRDFTETLMVDPRTKSVQDFVFTWGNGDALGVSLMIYPTVGDPSRLEVTING